MLICVKRSNFTKNKSSSITKCQEFVKQTDEVFASTRDIYNKKRF